MSRAPSDRPVRRLDAVLTILRKHGVETFEAVSMPGVGEGIKMTLREGGTDVPGSVVMPPRRSSLLHPELNGAEPEAPMDELALVAEGREGPVPGNGVS